MDNRAVALQRRNTRVLFEAHRPCGAAGAKANEGNTCPNLAYLTLPKCRAPADVGDHGLPQLSISCHLQNIRSSYSTSNYSFYSVHVFLPLSASCSATWDSSC